MELLQEYVFIALDIFQKSYENKDRSKRTRFEAWLTFLCDDRPEEILKLLEEYPEFKSLYNEVYDMCRNMEDFMRLFSKELEELDKNTVQYMIDEMQDTIDEQKKELDAKEQQLKANAQQLNDQNRQLDMQNRQLQEKDQTISELLKKIADAGISL